MKPVASFNIYASGTLFYRVHIWNTFTELQKHVSPWVRVTRGCKGICSSYEVIKNDILTGCLGEINFLKKHLTTEILSHEVCHGTFGYMERRGLILNRVSGLMRTGSDEEKACYAHGRMMRALVNKLYKLKLIGT